MRELSIAGKIAARPSLPSNRSSIHCSHFFNASLRNGWMLCSANHSANLCKRSSHRKKLRQRDFFRVGRQRQVAFVDTFGIKLVQIDLDRARRLEMVDDGQRHEHAARPVAHLPKIHVEPFADAASLRTGWSAHIPTEKARAAPDTTWKRCSCAARRPKAAPLPAPATCAGPSTETPASFRAR